MEASTRKPSASEWWLDLLLVVVMLAGAFLRFSGIYWGEWTYMHPDERFLVWVGTDISPLQPGSDPEARQWLTLNEYFDTPNSPLNPNNRGHGFYVYGTLPMFLTRYAIELIYDVRTGQFLGGKASPGERVHGTITQPPKPPKAAPGGGAPNPGNK